MSKYISVAGRRDPDELAELAYNHMQEKIPGWEPSDGQLDVWLIQVVARLAADLENIALDVPDTIFRFFGEEVMQIPSKLGSYAYFTATVVAEDDAGYIIPAGLTIAVRDAAGTAIGFQSVAETSIPPGSTDATGVMFVSIDTGTDKNGLDTSTVQIVDAIFWIEEIIGDDVTSGGSDPETDDEYMARLVAELRLMTPRPVVPVDYAVIAERIEGVDRAYYINLYNADSNTPNQEKAITIVVTDADGLPVSSGTKSEVDALLQSMREVNMMVFVADPQYQPISADFSVRALPGFDTLDVDLRVTAALQSYLSPANWGRIDDEDNAGHSARAITWRPVNVVRYLEVAQVVNNVEGVDYIISLSVNSGTGDVTLNPGVGVPVVLPTPGGITGNALPSQD